MKNSALIFKLISSYLLILIICIILYYFLFTPLNPTDTINVKIGILSWSASFYAPIAAYFFFDSWKLQIKEQRKEMFILNYLKEIESIRDFLSSIILYESELKDLNLITNKLSTTRKNINPKHLETSKILKIYLKDNELNKLIDEEFNNRSKLISNYLNDLKEAYLSKNDEDLQNFHKKYSTDKFKEGIIIHYANDISKPVCEYCYNLLRNF
ncbi:hypothetical protein [Acinetobacter nosocomialis]|uniref:hypothetical protein n=1 Tax=Acinetobacter nosocomialis TaxID=106654 RepID=UPI00124E8EB6|nr:hypothetical protein [Acinetobacter nosocomialis]